MKAKAGFLMLLIGMICFTGFGLTTADLTDNSTTELIQMDHSANVVSVSVMEITFDLQQIGTAFSLAENKVILPAMEFANTISSKLNLTTNITDDVGWQRQTNTNFANTINSESNLTFNLIDDVGWRNSNYEKENYNLKTKLHFSQRKARDGIMYGSFFSS